MHDNGGESYLEYKILCQNAKCVSRKEHVRITYRVHGTDKGYPLAAMFRANVDVRESLNTI